MDYFVKRAVEKRRKTIALRKNDTGCECHGLDLCKCPNYKPEVWRNLSTLSTAFYNRSSSERREVN